MAKRDYYSVLELKKEATRAEIEEAFRELTAVYGFDSDGTYSLYDEDERSKLLTEIKEAYSVLSDELKRKQYDQNVIFLSDYKEPARPEKVSHDPQPEKSSEKLKELFADFDPERIDGGFLKSLREAVPLSIKEVAAQTRLSSTMVEMLEQNNFVKLPGRTYVLGFAKLYFRIFVEEYEKFAQAYIKKYDAFMEARRGVRTDRES